jgi:UDP-N-acetyl-2-amino-2-deoxyglucuronate dehydrogenase
MHGIGIVGTGSIAKHQARAIAALEGARVVAVMSRDSERAREFGREFGCNAYGEEETFLSDPDLSIVSICTPSGSHMESAVAAAAAGKHLMIEKPLEVTLDRCDRIIEAAHRHGVSLGGVFQSRYFESSRVIRDAIDRGRFGRLVLADAYVKWFRSQAYYDQGGWRGTRLLDGGGALMNQSIHAIDLLQWYMGPVDSVQAVTATLGHERIEVEDTAVATVRFQNGALGVIEGSTAAFPGFLKRIEISGTAGSVIQEEEDLKTWTFAQEEAADEEVRRRYGAVTGSGGGASDPGAISTVGHRRQFADFVRSIDEGMPYELNGEEARKSVAIILAIYESAASGRPVAVSTP